MELRIDRQVFSEAFSIVSRHTHKSYEKMAGVRLEATAQKCELTACNPDMSIIKEIAAEVTTPGIAILPKHVALIASEMTDETISLSVRDNYLVFSGMQSLFHIPTSDPKDFPSVDRIGSSAIEIPGKAFRELVSRTGYAIDVDATRFALSGVLLEFADGVLSAVGTDGRRLSVQAVGGLSEFIESCIVSPKCLHAVITGDEPVLFMTSGNNAFFKSGSAEVRAMLIDGRFPAWRKIVPESRDGEVAFLLPVGKFASTVRQAAIAADSDTRGVNVTFGPKALRIASSEAKGAAKASLPVETGLSEDVTIKIDYRFLLDILKTLDLCGQIKAKIVSDKAPVFFETEDGFRSVVMPMAV